MNISSSNSSFGSAVFTTAVTTVLSVVCIAPASAVLSAQSVPPATTAPATPAVTPATTPATTSSASAPTSAPAPALKLNWYNLDLAQDSVFGISTERAYAELLASKPARKRIIVAIIDGGTDPVHPDLQPNIWVNPKEVSGNNKDDDRNGYADDVHGWNFLGSSKGDVEYETLELTRRLNLLKPRYETVADPSALSAAQQDTLKQFKSMIGEYYQRLQSARLMLATLSETQGLIDTLLGKMGTSSPTLEQVDTFQVVGAREFQAKRALLAGIGRFGSYEAYRKDQLDRGIKHFKSVIDYHLNFDYNPRSIVGDNPKKLNERKYGNANVQGPDGEHGTHVAGIVGAVRRNGLGIDGVADSVILMPVRAIPSGDERDKDVANAIRYAVDNGAKIINMSFGKSYSPNKKVVDDAVKHAMSKDVLLVHGAGNDGVNLDKGHNFPNRHYLDGGEAKAWIEVGATSSKNDRSLVAVFSNYGKTSVDVFAPGVRIYSTVPDATYQDNDGTSMAAPVVSGLAALIWSRYPDLSAVQVKDIIMQSVAKPETQVTVRDGQMPVAGTLADFSVSGGIVNAYNALKLAETYSK